MRPVTRHLDLPAPGSEDPPRDTRVAVVLLHLGGPDSMDDIEPFYRQLWKDREIAPPRPRGFFAGISNALGRSRRDDDPDAWKEHGEALQIGHQLVGGRSPALDLVGSQALALENRLNRRPVMAPSVGGSFRVFHGFRYASPSIEDAVDEAAKTGAQELVAVPMYTQRSACLTGPCLEAFTRAAEKAGVRRASCVDGFHEHPRLTAGLTERVKRSLDLVPTELKDDVFLIFSAHSPPQARARADGYLSQVESTAQQVMASVGFDEERSAVAWTSFRGAAGSLTPSVSELCQERGAAGQKALVVVPISYVSDCYETLHDLDIEAFGAATASGVVQFRRTPTLNADSGFIDLLAGLVLARVPDEAKRWAREGAPVRVSGARERGA